MPASDLRVRNTKAPEGASGKPKLVGSGGSMVAKLKLKGLWITPDPISRIRSDPDFAYEVVFLGPQRVTPNYQFQNWKQHLAAPH